MTDAQALSPRPAIDHTRLILRITFDHGVRSRQEQHLLSSRSNSVMVSRMSDMTWQLLMSAIVGLILTVAYRLYRKRVHAKQADKLLSDVVKDMDAFRRR